MKALICRCTNALALLCSFFVPAIASATCEGTLEPSTPTTNFVLNANGTAKDLTTGLVWDRCAYGQTWNGTTQRCDGAATSYGWSAALDLAQSLTNYKGGSDWRVPNIKELRSIVEECRYNPSFNLEVFPDTPVENWFSSTIAYQTGGAWYVGGAIGASSYEASPATTPLRLVRAGDGVDGYPTAIDGSCGAANGFAVAIPPTLNLCAAGAVSQFAGTGPWTWTCLGANGGTPASCGAPLLDLAPPVLSGVSATSTTLTASSSKAATGYWIALAHGAAVPTVVQVQAFAIYGTAGVLARGTGAMAAGVAKTFAVSGLNANTVYDFYIVAEDASQNISARGSAQNGVGEECASSSVSTIQYVDLSDSMIASAKNNLLGLRSTFNVTCASGRFGVVRLPKLVANTVNGPLNALGGQAYALVQTTCATKPVQRLANPPATVATRTASMAVRTSHVALLSDPLVGPLANWICE